MELTAVKQQNNYEQSFKEATGLKFTDFYQKYYTKLVWHIQKFNITELDAEGIASTAMMQGLEKIDGYNPKYHPSTWMFTIGKNLALQYKIDSKKEVLVDTSGDYSDDDSSFSTFQYYLNSKIDNSEETIGNEAISNEKYQETLKEISKLDNKYKEFIELRDIQGKEYDEIAEILGVKLQTVKNRLHHGRMKLKNNTSEKFRKIVQNN